MSDAKPTALVLRSMPQVTPHSIDELADTYLVESHRLLNERQRLSASYRDQ